jgi:hypothetical protein
MHLTGQGSDYVAEYRARISWVIDKEEKARRYMMQTRSLEVLKR